MLTLENYSSAPRKVLNPWLCAHTYQNVLRFFLTTNWMFGLVLYYSCLNFKFVIFVFITWEYWLTGSIWSLLCFSSCHRQLMKTHLKLEKSVDVLTYKCTSTHQHFIFLQLILFLFRFIFLVPLLVAFLLRSLQKWPTKVLEFTLWYYVTLLLILQSFNKQQPQPRKLMGHKYMYKYCTTNKLCPTSEFISYFIFILV